MFSDAKLLGRESLIYGLSTVVARLLNFFLVPFYTYYMAAGEYGVSTTVFSYIAFLNIVFQYGMDQAYMRFSSDPELDRTKVFSVPMWCIICTSAALGGFLFLFAPQMAVIGGIGAEYSTLVSCAAIVLATDSLLIVPFAKLRMEHRAWYFVGVKTASIVVNVACNVLFLVVMHKGALGVLAASVVASVISMVLLLPVYRQVFRWVFDMDLLRRMLVFAWPFIPAGIASMIVNVIDRPILLFLTDPATVGIYQANYRMGIFMMLVVSMFEQAWRPFFLERARHENARQIFASVFTGFTFAGVWIVLALSLFIGDFIRFSFFGLHLLNPSYWGGIKIIPVVLCGYLFYGFYINFMVAPVLTKKTASLVWIAFLGGVTNIVANFALIPYFSMMGAAVATLLAYMAMAGGLYWFLRREYPVPYEGGRVALLAGSGLLLYMVSLGAERLVSGVSLFAVKVLLLVSFPVALWAAGFFSSEEKAALRSIPQFLMKKAGAQNI